MQTCNQGQKSLNMSEIPRSPLSFALFLGVAALATLASAVAVESDAAHGDSTDLTDVKSEVVQMVSALVSERAAEFQDARYSAHSTMSGTTRARTTGSNYKILKDALKLGGKLIKLKNKFFGSQSSSTQSQPNIGTICDLMYTRLGGQFNVVFYRLPNTAVQVTPTGPWTEGNVFSGNAWWHYFIFSEGTVANLNAPAQDWCVRGHSITFK